MAFRRRKNLPPGTFIPTSQRLMAIGQLCFAFSLMFSYLVQPFMGEYFALRSRMLLYEYVMGTSEVLKSQGDQTMKLERQVDRFKQLPENQRQLVLKDYQQLQTYSARPTIQKIHDGIRILINKVPPFEQAWIFFAITISILILLKIEGAKQAAWILPLIVLIYSIDNQLTGKPSLSSPDLRLFPTEKIIVEQYLNEPLSPIIYEQKQQLEKGWNHYLIKNWLPNSNLNEEPDLEKAEFQFTLARLNLLHHQPQSEWLHRFHEKANPFLLILFLGWNILFAFVVSSQKLEKFKTV